VRERIRLSGDQLVIQLNQVSKSIGSALAIAPVSTSFASARTTVIIGPSGCGKTTLLRLLLGLTQPDSGEIRIDGERLTPDNAQSLRHRIGYVIQDGGLFPHLTARHNVTLLARYLGVGDKQAGQRCQALAELVRIQDDMLARYPRQLSGGQRQRVALMRALMLDPPLLLMDEPLAALDPMTRHTLQADLKQIFAQLRKTVVMVTHDMHEAAHFADEIVLMRAGRIVQRGQLDELLAHPAEAFVTEFIRAQRADARLAAT
jgi:osmoprotectant transport system ATP-binding protein